jgi:hypothetical protein
LFDHRNASQRNHLPTAAAYLQPADIVRLGPDEAFRPPHLLELTVRQDLADLHVANVFLNLFEAAELEQGRPPRVGFADAASHLFIDEQLQRRPQLGVEVGLDAAPPQKVAAQAPYA